MITEFLWGFFMNFGIGAIGRWAGRIANWVANLL